MAKNKFLFPVVSFLLALPLTACSSNISQETSGKEHQEERDRAEIRRTHDWSYDGENGPEHWDDLDPANAVCANGKEQSPINIVMARVIESEQLKKMEINYTPSDFSLVNNGHTIQANARTMDNIVTARGKEYTLVQFHFHAPSEHQFNGQHFDMELHLVHKDEKDQLAVIAVMMKEGMSNRVLANVWSALPEEETAEGVKLSAPVDLMSILPKDQQSFQYRGSLTTPPCSEAVQWIVLGKPIDISKEQIDAFRQIYPNNHRPIQALEDRKVMEK